MQLKPIVADSLDFSEFLGRLKEHPEIADTAPALILRAVRSRGVVDIEKEPADRRPYLELLQAMRIPAWKAFDHVRGSQKTVHRIMSALASAANGGYELRKALLLIGGPGCGKSFLANAIKATLEGELVYVVDGCPIHENPINLLKLLSAEQLDALAIELGMNDPEKGVTLSQLLNVAGEPCKHCWKKVMIESNEGGVVKYHDEPNLGSVKITEMRLTSRNFGISTWVQTEGGCSLVESLKQGSRGVVDLPEMCAVQKAGDGETLQIDALISATEDRSIPDLSSCGDNAGTLPLNALIIGQSNQGSWNAFLSGQKDPKKFIRRMTIHSVPYITSRIEEELVYREAVAKLIHKPHFDPNAFGLAATLAVGSRLTPVPGLSPIAKVRLYNGETFVVRKDSSPSSSGGIYGGYNSTPSQWTEKELGELMKASNLEVKDEATREGMFGLDLPFMIGFMGSLAELAMRGPKHPAFPNAEPCVTAIGMIDALRARLEAYKDTNGLNDQDKKLVETLLTTWMKKPKDTSDTPGLLEKEYRRLLKQQILDAFSPDYERRAQDMFEKYKLHSRYYGNGQTKFRLPGTVKDIDVDTAFLDLVDKGQSLKAENLKTAKEYRGSIDAQLNDLNYSQGTLPSEDADKLKVDWTTLPELKQAIEDYLNADIAKKVERILVKKYDLLDEEDKEAFDAAFASFKEHGYCEICFARALEYAKELKLWAKAQD
jgi:predicted Ser/Thr protein kinase